MLAGVALVRFASPVLDFGRRMRTT
jgi:hypothetical protein